VLSLGCPESGKDDTIVVCDVPLRGKLLAKLKRRAQRCKSWFSVLSWEQRRFVDAVIMVVETVRSPLLADLLKAIIKTLLEAMMKNGRSLAQKLSQIAQSWGNKSAVEWPLDRGFIQYLTVIDLNKP
jgi:hypothetical protein